jgi:hypothetical protein
MGWLLFASIAAMTGVMTMIQLIVLTLTLPTSATQQAKIGPERTAVVAAKSDTKKMGSVATRRSARHHTRRHSKHSAHVLNTSHQKREAGYR